MRIEYLRRFLVAILPHVLSFLRTQWRKSELKRRQKP